MGIPNNGVSRLVVKTAVLGLNQSFGQVGEIAVAEGEIGVACCVQNLGGADQRLLGVEEGPRSLKTCVSMTVCLKLKYGLTNLKKHRQRVALLESLICEERIEELGAGDRAIWAGGEVCRQVAIQWPR